MKQLIDGFWLPTGLHDLLTPETLYEVRSYAAGKPCAAGDPDAVTVRWPLLDPDQWAGLLRRLDENRPRVPQGKAFLARLEKALASANQSLAGLVDPQVLQARQGLPGYTGFSPEMIEVAMGAFDLMALGGFGAAFAAAPDWKAARRWQAMPGLPGRLRFNPANNWQKNLAGSFLSPLILRGQGKQALFGPLDAPELVVGFGAGNVPGTALLIALLALSTTLAGGAPPAVVVKNSRREPIFTPLILRAIEAVDPELVASTAVLAWDYGEADLQKRLLAQADLAIAAASDETIAQIWQSAAEAGRAGGKVKPLRFHAHGHKVSFAAISREVLADGLRGASEAVDPASGQAVSDIVALLAALDSIFWDQYGCLSARIHFVETGGDITPDQYAQRLAAYVKQLAQLLPRGNWPRQRMLDAFDRYKILEPGGKVKVYTEYDDPFLVILDEHPLTPASFQALINTCLGRVIVVRPVAGLMEIPETYLRWLPPGNLQSLSVATGQPGQETSQEFLRFAAACGERGVTAIRSVGRGAFPQLAYSWDGLIPWDLVRSRPEGHFTTIEFDRPYDEMLQTFALFLHKGFQPPGTPS